MLVYVGNQNDRVLEYNMYAVVYTTTYKPNPMIEREITIKLELGTPN
jgi:hypothetical protein